jgi:hypothetical protein
MTQQMPRSSVASAFAIALGLVAFLIPVWICISYPNVPIVVAMALGAIIATPLLVLGFRIHPDASAKARNNHFLPSQPEKWSMASMWALAVADIMPPVLCIAIAYLLPAGDDWGFVALRLSLLVIAGCAWVGWRMWVRPRIETWFRGKTSNDVIEITDRHERQDIPRTAIASEWNTWGLALIAIPALCVAFGLFDFDNPWLDSDVERSRGQGRVYALIIAWCRANPNTVWSVSLLLGAGALGLFAFRVGRAFMPLPSRPQE